MSDRFEPRTDRIFLDTDLARCEPRIHCAMRSHCARYMALLPASGGAMMDGTSDPHWTPSYCGHYIPASKCLRKQAPPPAPPKRRHWDHDEG